MLLTNSQIIFVLGLTAFWLVVAIPIYRILRAVIVRDPASLTRRVLFTLVCGTVVAPGLVGVHPPPIPFPGAAVLGFVYLSQVLRGPAHTDNFYMAFANLASWAVVTACIGIGELWRLRRQAYVVKNALAAFPRNVAAGLRTGEPRWPRPTALLMAAIPVFLLLNGPVGEPVRMQGRVIVCGPQIHWLTRIETPGCGAELSDGLIYSFRESDYGIYGHTITILRFRRRFVGTHDVVLKHEK